MDRNDRKLYEAKLKYQTDSSKLTNNPDVLYRPETIGNQAAEIEEKKAVDINSVFQKNWGSMREKLAAAIKNRQSNEDNEEEDRE